MKKTLGIAVLAVLSTFLGACGDSKKEGTPPPAEATQTTKALPTFSSCQPESSESYKANPEVTFQELTDLTPAGKVWKLKFASIWQSIVIDSNNAGMAYGVRVETFPSATKASLAIRCSEVAGNDALAIGIAAPATLDLLGAKFRTFLLTYSSGDSAAEIELQEWSSTEKAINEAKSAAAPITSVNTTHKLPDGTFAMISEAEGSYEIGTSRIAMIAVYELADAGAFADVGKPSDVSAVTTPSVSSLVSSVGALR